MRPDEWKVPAYSAVILIVVLGSASFLSVLTENHRPAPNHKLRLLS